MQKHLKKVKKFFKENERSLSVVALVTGFVVDSLTLTRIDLLLDNLILFSYLTLAAVSIILINSLKASSKIRAFLPYTMQYAFGGLFSGYVIFYSRSATLAGSALFLLILILLLLGNEFFKERYARLTFQMGILFVAIFSFSIFFVPIIIGQIGAWVFLLSGLASLLLIGAVFHILDKFTPRITKKSRVHIGATIGTIYVLFNILYFTSLIPPLPLSLKELDIYYSVQRADAESFIVQKEEFQWYEFYKKDEFKLTPGSPLYSFSSVFAPTRINDTIVHEWSYWNEDSRKWTLRSSVQFPISGGRDNGYRGYTLRRDLESGKWRIDVKTIRGELLGRTTFTVMQGNTSNNLISEVK